MTLDLLPFPSYVDDAWLIAHGVSEPDVLKAAMRPENEVMRPATLRAIKATRLSFARSLLRRMSRNRWNIQLIECEINREGAGMLVYRIDAEGHLLHFAVASLANQGTELTGRICENTYDFFGTFVEGPLDMPRIRAELAEFSSKVWAGRTDNTTLGWTVANRSNRFFNHVVSALIEERQPEQALLASGGGYIIRNAGWYGNGRQGSRSWTAIGEDHPLGLPYHLDIFALYMWRVVGFDCAQAMAKANNGSASLIDEAIKNTLGIGNSSGIGIVAALVRWPVWLSAYNFLRELALAHALTSPATTERMQALAAMLERCADYYAEQPDVLIDGIERPTDLSAQLHQLSKVAVDCQPRTVAEMTTGQPWQALSRQAASMSLEAREQLHSLLIEMDWEFADEVASLTPQAFAIPRKIEPQMRLGTLRTLIETRYGWALAFDLSMPDARTYFWYRSEENGENRRGECGIDPGEEFGTFVDVAGMTQQLYKALNGIDDAQPVAEFLLAHPDLSHIVSRVQLSAHLPYSELRANIQHRDFQPMAGIRFLLVSMGLEASNPLSTRWVRGVFLLGSPLPPHLLSGKSSDGPQAF